MDLAFNNLPVGIRKKSEDLYEIGVTIDGGFFVFGGFKAGGFDEDLREAREAIAAQPQTSQPQPVV